MAREIRIRVIKRREIDEEKLALAFWLLAKSLYEQEQEGTLEHAEEVSPAAESRPTTEAA